ncbi:MAG TPA: hypothetical protein PKO30_10460 [Prolixibacteraceae bacterium]|nr:hypothetical protein [Prolixibacteraceae bacterium]
MNVISTCLTGTATILTCRKIAQSFSENIYELSSIRRNWSPDYAANLKERIDRIMSQNFTQESLTEHLEMHGQFYELMISALKDVSVFRAEMKIDFKHDKDFLDEAFENLGYVDFFSEAKNGDLFSLYKMMATFKRNMTPELFQIIKARGINESLINRLLAYKEQLKDLRNCFDISHGKDQLNADLKKEINSVYGEVKDICRIANAYYEFDPVQRDRFNFYKVMIKLKRSAKETA